MTKVPSRGFSRDEFAARLAAVQVQMASQRMGALLLTTESDIFYFTGFGKAPPALGSLLSPPLARPLRSFPKSVSMR
jgi:Xaa-Pro aminopeptidase